MRVRVYSDWKLKDHFESADWKQKGASRLVEQSDYQMHQLRRRQELRELARVVLHSSIPILIEQAMETTLLSKLAANFHQIAKLLPEKCVCGEL